jgi:hypothetical protein
VYLFDAKKFVFAAITCLLLMSLKNFCNTTLSGTPGGLCVPERARGLPGADVQGLGDWQVNTASVPAPLTKGSAHATITQLLGFGKQKGS